MGKYFLSEGVKSRKWHLIVGITITDLGKNQRVGATTLGRRPLAIGHAQSRRMTHVMLFNYGETRRLYRWGKMIDTNSPQGLNVTPLILGTSRCPMLPGRLP